MGADAKDVEAFLKWWEKENEAKRDPKGQLLRREHLDEFRKKYGAIRTTLMACPSCREGTLWSTSKSKFGMVCRRCEIEFELECITMPNDALTLKIRKSKRE